MHSSTSHDKKLKRGQMEAEAWKEKERYDMFEGELSDTTEATRAIVTSSSSPFLPRD